MPLSYHKQLLAYLYGQLCRSQAVHRHGNIHTCLHIAHGKGQWQRLHSVSHIRNLSHDTMHGTAGAIWREDCAGQCVLRGGDA